MTDISSGYSYNSPEPSWSNAYLWAPLRQAIVTRLKPGARIIDVGCGSGATANMLTQMGFEVVGIDPSSSGIVVARAAYPDVQFAQRSAYDDLVKEFGQFDAVVSLEVVEHCFDPKLYAANVFSAIRPGGYAFISTPYHGYWKNLAIALINGFDAHWSPLWDGGHIKFWSEASIRTLLVTAGFDAIAIKRVGRLPPVAKSMLVTAQRQIANAGVELGQ